jgi:alpha/beta superfamily hydrolase
MGDALAVAQRVSDDPARTERLEFIEGVQGRLYTWLAYPEEVRDVIIVCSPFSGDFSANYHRERLLAHASLSRGFGVARFHYCGEGNSEGDPSRMTFASLCEDTDAVARHVLGLLGAVRLSYLGTRLGALVAASAASQRPRTPLVMWEPVIQPQRFYREAYLAKRASLVATDDAAVGSFFEDLERDGIVDIVGYSLYPALVNSLEHVDLRTLLEAHDGPRYVARFGQARRSEANGKPRTDDDAIEETFAVDGAWWFHDERVVDDDPLVEATLRWLRGAAGGTQT